LTEPGWAIWITGLPASGKSTLARNLKRKLSEIDVEAQILESDALRLVLTPNPSYSPEERETFYNSLVYIGTLLAGNGVNVIFDAVANKRKWRMAARNLIDDFLEFYMRCPIETCMDRDEKGLYEKAKAGEARYVPGAQEVFEKPFNADLVLDCVKDPLKVQVEKCMEVLEKNGFV
jgi:adenylylsulfate kinase